MPSHERVARFAGTAPRFFDDIPERSQHLRHTLATYGGQNQRRFFRNPLEPRHLLLDFVRTQRIRFVERDNFRLIRKFLPISRKLGPYRLVSLAGIFTGAIDEMQQNPTALDMTKKTIAEPDAFVGTLDQTWNIGEPNFPAID